MSIPPRPVTWQRTLLFFVGLGAFIREAVLQAGPERPVFIMAYLGMMGMPVFLWADERRRETPDATTPGETEE